MSRKTFCTLSASHLLHNLKTLQSKAPQSKTMAMVKANAYGHGLRSVAKRLEGFVDALGVASVDEALALREAGVQTPLTLIEGVFSPEELDIAAAQRFSVVFHSDHQLHWLKGAKLPDKITAWLKINTGLGRLGFAPDQALKILKNLSGSTSLHHPIGLMSHFACADQPHHELNKKQMEAFEALAKNHQGPKSFCNSAALLTFPSMHYEWVRPGLALYGASPFLSHPAEEFDLKPVMTFATEIIALQKCRKGDTIGYGAEFTCDEDMPVAIIAVGYGDGYPRLIGKKTFALVGTARCPVIGRVSMDMAALDLRSCPGAQVGDRVTLWGEGLPIEELAHSSERSVYDLMTGVQNRVKFTWAD